MRLLLTERCSCSGRFYWDKQWTCFSCGKPLMQKVDKPEVEVLTGWRKERAEAQLQENRSSHF